MAFGSTPLSTTSLGNNQFPVSAVAVPNETGGNLTALEGGPESTDSNGNKTAPVSMYVKDGGNVTQGTSTDANTVNSMMGRLTKIRDLLNATLTVGGTITEANSASIKSDLDAINTAIGAISDAAWGGSGNGSEIAILKKIVAELAATLTVSGTVTANAGSGTFTNQQSNITIDYDTGAGTQNLTMFGVALPASGGAVSGGTSNNPLRTDPTGTTTQPVSGTITANAGTGNFNDASVASTGAAVPASASYLAGNKSGNLTGISLDGSGNLNVNVAAGGASGGTSSTYGSTFPSTGTAIGASDGTNMQALQVESSSNKNLRVALYNGSTEASVTGSNALKVDGSSVTQPVSGTITANAGTGTFTNQQSNNTADYDTGAGTQTMTLFGVALPASGGAVAGGTSTNPLRTDPTGVTTQPVSGTITANIGTTNGVALDTSVNGVIVAQGSSTSGGKGPLIQGAVTTSAPTYTTAQTSPISLTTSGAVRVDNSANTQPVSGTITANAGSGNFTVAQTTGSNLHTVIDAGSAVIGHVINDASSAVIGHVIADSGSTTAVTQATASNLNAQVVGSVASGASNAGNPVKDGGVFNTTQPTVTNGQVVDAQYTARGAAIVATGVDSFAVNASQSGTWNVNNVSGTVSLPTGAATSAKQPALGTAGSASADVMTVQGITSMTALKTDGSGVTQPVSGTVSITANSAVNVAQIAGTTTDTNSGNKSAGTQRIVLATDQPQLTNALKVDGSGVTQPISGTVTANAGTGTFTNQQSNITADYDSGAGTQNLTMFGVAIPASGGAVAGGTSTNPLRTDPTGTTTQPVSGTVTANAGSGTFTIQSNASMNVNQVAGSSVATAATGIMKVGITDASGNVLNSSSNALNVSGQASGSVSTTLQNAQAGNANGTSLTVLGMATVVFTVTASGFTGTVNFEASEDNSNWSSLLCTLAGGTTTATSASGAGQYSASCAGLQSVRARTSGVSAGNVTVTAHAVPVSGGGGGGGGSGSNASVSATASSVPSSASYIGGNKAGNLVGVSLDGSGNLNVNVAAGGGSGGTSSSFGSALPATGTAIGFTDGTNMQAGKAFDVDTGAGTEYVVGAILRKSASGGSVEAGTSSNPLRTDPTGTTTQPVSGTVSITANSAVNVAQVAGTTTDTNSGNKSAGTQRVVLATDQPQLTNALKVDGSGVTQPVSGTVTANAGTGTFTNQQSNVTTDYDTGAGTQTMTMFGLALPASGGSVAGGTSTNPVQVSLANTAANSTAVKVDGSAVTQPVSGTVSITSNSAVNVAQVGGTNSDTNSGNKSAGTLRVVLATDQPALTNKLLVTPDSVALPANQSVNVSQINGVTATMGNGVSGTGVQRVTLASDSTGQVTLASGSNVIGHVIADSGSTTAATQATASNLNAQVVGSVASAGSNAGNPVKVGGAFNTTQPTVTNGQIVDAQMTARGAAIVATGTDTFSVTVNAALPTGGNTVGAVTQASGPWTQNVTQFGSSNVATGTGTSGSGVPRVTVSNDSQLQIWDGTTGPVAVKAANTIATLADKSYVHTISPNNTGLPVNLPGIVQSTNNKSSGSVTSLAKAFVSNNVQGNSIIVVCGVGNGTAPTISDTNSNTYTQAAQINNSTALNVAVFYAVNIASGANTVTVNNGGSTASIAMEIYEVSGLIAQIQAQPDQTATSTGSSGTSSTSAISALSPNEYAFAGIGIGTAAQTITAGSGWTNDSGQQNPTTPAGLFSFVSMSQFLGSLKAITPQATFTSEPWAIAVATFRPVIVGIEGTVNIAQLNGAAISNTNPVPSQDIEQANYVSASSPPSTTNAGSDTTYTFSSQVSRVVIQNKTSANVYVAFDATASAGSLVLTPGSLLVYPKKCTAMHLFTAASQNINGSTSTNIVVLGAL